MIEELPTYINLLFGATVILSIGWFYWAVRSKTCLLLIIGWTILQSVIGLQGFYQDLEAMPPKIMLFGILPTLILITIIFKKITDASVRSISDCENIVNAV